jgi:hypothetical protein
MDSASSLAYPGSRVLAGWWRQLEPHRPAALWVGHLFVHRVEALVETAEAQPLDPLALYVLRAVAVDAPEPAPEVQLSQRLPGRLHLPAPAVQRLLVQMQGRQLVQRCERGCWCLSEHGKAVLVAGADSSLQHQRYSFAFVESLTPTGRREGPPRFLALAECPAQPWVVDEAHHFDPTILGQCLAETPEWKREAGFPAGPVRLVTAVDESREEAWQRIMLDRPERVTICLVCGADQSVRGFAVHSDTWKLDDRTPAFHLPGGSRDVFGDLALAPSAWQEAWRMWCRQRALPLSEAEACRLRFDGIQLRVSPPESFAQRLRQAKHDLFREEAGLLAGDGYLRAVAVLRLETDHPAHNVE